MSGRLILLSVAAATGTFLLGGCVGVALGHSAAAERHGPVTTATAAAAATTAPAGPFQSYVDTTVEANNHTRIDSTQLVDSDAYEMEITLATGVKVTCLGTYRNPVTCDWASAVKVER